ncbi:uncharacterized protein LOC143891039 [Tasmannia lanceolata]|uniref:uncharacterized protein LOC143891039 n=1 Tax=Tasmannia lanceolata TaxID=3420 RepID=UPI004063B117
MAARKLRPYFQAHTIKVLTDQQLRQVLHKPDTSGRLVKWAVELSEFDIRYMPRPAIKAQVLADFVAECSIPRQAAKFEIVQTPVMEKSVTQEERAADEAEAEIVPAPAEQDPSAAKPLWEVYVDRYSNRGSCGAGLILTGPNSFTADYALRFGFRASNNEAEYEALHAGMNLDVQVKAQRLRAYCDSQLVTNQIQGTYEARDERMIKYLSLVQQLSTNFKSFEVIRIPRAENTKGDVLSKLAASGYITLGNICMEFLQRPIIERKAVEIMKVEHESCWMDEIVDYLRSGKLPEAKKEARKALNEVNIINSQAPCPWKTLTLLDKICLGLAAFVDWKVTHVWREANSAADFLSKEDCPCKGDDIPPSSIPISLKDIIATDSAGVPYTRT